MLNHFPAVPQPPLNVWQLSCYFWLTSDQFSIDRAHPNIACWTLWGACWEPVDPVVADPVRQDNDKRNNIQIYIYIYIYIRKLAIKVHRGRGQNFPIFISCRYLVELGPRPLGLPVAELDISSGWPRWFQKGSTVSNNLKGGKARSFVFLSFMAVSCSGLVWRHLRLRDTSGTLKTTLSTVPEPLQNVLGKRDSGVPNFIHPSPQPWKYPARGGGHVKEGGWYKFLPQGAAK